MPTTARISPARWIDEHGDALFRYAMLRLGDRAAAEDAVQETLLAALKAADSYQGRSTERTWLVGILRHKVLDAIRARSRTRAATLPTDAQGPPNHAAPAAPWPVGPENAENAEMLAIVRQELMALGSPAREALCMRIVDGLDSQTVCQILGLTPTNLWTIVHRGRMALRQRVDQRLRDAHAEQGGSDNA
jgi:RNA polymerase sigma-70 factor (ECF subfamily)